MIVASYQQPVFTGDPGDLIVYANETTVIHLDGDINSVNGEA